MNFCCLRACADAMGFDRGDGGVFCEIGGHRVEVVYPDETVGSVLQDGELKAIIFS